MTDAPEQMGPFRLLGLLGQGGGGVVYRAEHRRTGAAAAVKTVAVPRPELMEGIRREIHALARLRHPGVVQILEAGVDSGVPWYAMELVEGQSLRELGRAAREEPRPLLSVLRRLCETLAFVHGEGIVHRDLKPGNVLVRPNGVPVLVDFGFASWFAASAGRDALDAAGLAVGTAAYMAPEQILGQLVDARADLYALGCMVYELFAGRPPFVGRSVAEVLRQHLSAEPEPLRKLALDLPEDLDSVLQMLLAKEPRDRLGHADLVAAALARLGAEDGLMSGATRPRAYLYRPSLAGRAGLLGELDRLMDQLKHGAGTLVLLGGESGAGKTRLAMETASRAQTRGIGILLGECLPDAAPLQPLRRPLQQIADQCRARPQADVDRIVGARGKLLAPYEPALAELPGHKELPEPADLPAEAARIRLFGALTELFGALASERARLLVFDDLQWADELTLGWIEHLVRSAALEPMRLLVVGTYRSEDAGAESCEPLRRLLAGPRGVRLELGRLTEAAVGQMVGEMLALSPPPGLFARFLARSSEGNPFFVGEYLRTAVSEGVLHRDEQGRWQVAGSGESEATESIYEALSLPRSVLDLVSRRLEGLDPGAAQLTEAAAVLGRESEPQLLADVSGLEEAERFAAVQQLLTRQVLEQTESGRLRFVHDKIREVAYARIAESRSRELHRRAALAVEARLAERIEEHYPALGWHWEKAGEPERARRSYLAAAGKAAAVYAYAETERLYRAYLRLVEEPTPESVQARIGLAWSGLMYQGRRREAVSEYEAALREARALGYRLGEAACLRGLAHLHLDLGQGQEAVALARQALNLFCELGDRSGEGRALYTIASAHSDLGQLEKAHAAYEQALAVARAAGHRDQEAAVLAGIGILETQRGRRQQAEALVRRALVLRRELGQRYEEGHVLGNLAELCSIRGDKAEARVLYGQVLDIGRETVEPVLQAVALTNLAVLDHDEGRLEEAGALQEQAIAMFRQAEHASHEAAARGNLGFVRHDQGRCPEARVLYGEALEMARRIGEVRWQGIWHVFRARLERHTGQMEEARADLDRAEALLRQVSEQEFLNMALCEQGHLELAEGRSGGRWLAEARALASASVVEGSGDLARRLARLERAQAAFERGGSGKLFRGELVEDLPAGLRRWLDQTGQRPGV
jgi:predicted ATPase